VYGNLYRKTSPEEWVFQQEEAHLSQENETYLLLLTASPEFLSAKDDGNSFSSTSSARVSEIQNFREACSKSCIKNFLEIRVEEGGKYLSENEITNQVLEFLK
jgi:hypothetical protein